MDELLNRLVRLKNKESIGHHMNEIAKIIEIDRETHRVLPFRLEFSDKYKGWYGRNDFDLLPKEEIIYE